MVFCYGSPSKWIQGEFPNKIPPHEITVKNKYDNMSTIPKLMPGVTLKTWQLSPSLLVVMRSRNSCIILMTIYEITIALLQFLEGQLWSTKKRVDVGRCYVFNIHSPCTCLVVQWLRVCASTAEDTGLIPGQGIKILYPTYSRGTKKEEKKNHPLFHSTNFY